MKFTDDDLKRLKELAEVDDWPISQSDAKALLARLEAAERSLKHLEVHDCQNCRQALQDWRKVAEK